MKITETLLTTPIAELPSNLTKLLGLFIEVHDSVTKKDRNSIQIFTELVKSKDLSQAMITRITYEREETELEVIQKNINNFKRENWV